MRAPSEEVGALAFRGVSAGTLCAESLGFHSLEVLLNLHFSPKQLILSFALIALAASCGGSGPGDDSFGSGEEASRNGSGDSDKVTLCHIPPGNPANAHTITVGAPAVRAHLAHGDYLGRCVGDVPPDSDGGVPNPNPNPNPGPGSDGGSNPNPGQCSAVDTACGTGLPPCCSGLTCNGTSCVTTQLN